jgi:hypothetical protein
MLLATAPGEVGADLLGAIRNAERWVEQETVAEELLLGLRGFVGVNPRR